MLGWREHPSLAIAFTSARLFASANRHPEMDIVALPAKNLIRLTHAQGGQRLRNHYTTTDHSCCNIIKGTTNTTRWLFASVNRHPEPCSQQQLNYCHSECRPAETVDEESIPLIKRIKD